MKRNQDVSIDKSTEEKIKIAAEKLFMENGFSGTRTRDIAEEAGINLALLNYYFRSKENLFNIIIMEKLEKFVNSLLEVFKNKALSQKEIIEQMVQRYYDLMIDDPQLPLFLMGEVQQNPDFFMDKLHVKAKIQSIALGIDNLEMQIQMVLDVISLVFYPFIVRKAFENVFEMSHEEYNQLLEKRRKYIPTFVSNMYCK